MSTLIRVGTDETVGTISFDASAGDVIALTSIVGETTMWLVLGREIRSYSYSAATGVVLYVASTAADGDPLNRRRVTLSTTLFSHPDATWEEIEVEVFKLAHPAAPA